jgi:glycosyltransferase involved in cell wall biosynthesis
MSASLPLVLCIVDKPGWAHDRKTDAVARELAGRYEITKRYQADVGPDDVDRADCVLVYYWLQIDRRPDLHSAFVRARDRLAIGICSEFELAGDLLQPGLEVLEDLASVVFVNSRQLLQQFAPQLSRPVLYTPNGVDTTFFHPARHARERSSFRVGWAGSLSNRPAGYRGVDEILAPAVEAVRGAELQVAAREDKWRDAEEMRVFYQSLDAYACVSVSEGTPNPCLEAAACGLPIVTTRVGNMPELIRDGVNGFFVERRADDVARALERLRDEPELRARLGRAARSSVEAWDWRRRAPAYDALFQTVLGAQVGGDVRIPGRHLEGPR